MLDISIANLKNFQTAWVGNKSRYEGVVIPESTLELSDVAHELITTTFLKPFEKESEMFHLNHHEDIELNEAYQVARNLFSYDENSRDAIGRLSQRLYEYSEYPKIRGGEFMLAVFEDVIYNGYLVSAIALVKVQSKGTFLKAERAGKSVACTANEGIETRGLDVAALILNIDEADGYLVMVIDKVSKASERSFWKDEFLRLSMVEDEYFNTRHHMNIASEVINKNLHGEERIDHLYRAWLYFKENDHFDADSFAEEIFKDEKGHAYFIEQSAVYAKAYGISLEYRFDISDAAVKKYSKLLKPVVKLDKNFSVSINGRRDLYERGFDEQKGKKYYKFYFDDED